MHDYHMKTYLKASSKLGLSPIVPCKEKLDLYKDPNVK